MNFPLSIQNDRAAWLRGRSGICSQESAPVNKPVRVVLLGPPGVGKGTQAALLAKRSGACHLSTGDVFRDAKSRSPREQSLAMASAVNLMQQGLLVPDTIVWQMIRERSSCLRCEGGFLLDGFPRTLGQAEALKLLLENEAVALDVVINYDLPFTEIVSRLSGRRTCASCKAIYHLTAQPAHVEGMCDRCGGVLFQREDDRPESVSVRLEAYEHSTAPLIQFYRNAGLLITVTAEGTPEEICERTIAALDAKRGISLAENVASL